MRQRVDTTSANGGSASSQATSLDQRAWAPHPWVSRAIRAAILIVPIIAGVVAVRLAGSIVERPDGTAGFWLWMTGLVALSTTVATGVHRLTRKLAPLGALLTMSLVFPDEAPSRFRTALRAGSARSLERDLASGQAPSDQQAAAEELVALLARLNAHDRLTRGHSERVRAYAVMLGEEIGLSPEELEKLNWAALIHDIGKLEVDGAILAKAGRPTDAEWEVLRTHPAAAAGYVEPLREWLGEWVEAATQHHERFDGTGYPNGLAGVHISRAGRIVAIADAFDVMTATRSYKKALPAAQARAELRRNAGSQFDPNLVRSFLQISVGRTRWVVGPLGWLAHFPDVIRTPLTTIASSGSTVVATAAVTLGTATGVMAEPPEPIEIVAPVERTISAAPTEDTVPATEPPDPASPSDAVVVPLATDESTTTTSTPDEPSSSTPTSTPSGGPTTTAAIPVTAATAGLPSTTTSAGPGPTASTTTTSTPSSTPVPPTTTGSTTTTTAPTTTSTTTTLAPIPLNLTMGGGGSTTSQDYLPLDGTLGAGALPNYDTDRDSDAGLLLQRGTGVTETDATRMQRWFGQLSGSSEVRGWTTVELWAAVKDFDTAASGHLEVGLYDCKANKTDCQMLAGGAASFSQASFGSDFGKVIVSLGAIDTVIGSNRALRVVVAPTMNSGGDIWLAYANTSYPMRLNVG